MPKQGKISPKNFAADWVYLYFKLFCGIQTLMKTLKTEKTCPRETYFFVNEKRYLSKRLLN